MPEPTYIVFRALNGYMSYAGVDESWADPDYLGAKVETFLDYNAVHYSAFPAWDQPERLASRWIIYMVDTMPEVGAICPPQDDVFPSDLPVALVQVKMGRGRSGILLPERPDVKVFHNGGDLLAHIDEGFRQLREAQGIPKGFVGGEGGGSVG